IGLTQGRAASINVVLNCYLRATSAAARITGCERARAAAPNWLRAVFSGDVPLTGVKRPACGLTAAEAAQQRGKEAAYPAAAASDTRLEFFKYRHLDNQLDEVCYH